MNWGKSRDGHTLNCKPYILQSKAKAESDLKRSELSYKMVVEQLRGAEKSKPRTPNSES